MFFVTFAIACLVLDFEYFLLVTTSITNSSQARKSLKHSSFHRWVFGLLLWLLLLFHRVSCSL